MIDFTTIQANPIPPPIIELQTVNTSLQGENNVLRNILFFGIVLLVIFNVDKVLTNLKEERKQKNLELF